jgi:glycosyltransferase involved in cell wall biosynthesis
MIIKGSGIMLSLCMIVKNEESTLKNCLDSIAPFVDEIIIVDTGSTDSTKTIALKYTEKVYDFIWCDNFSKARNFSISKASNDWILVLDSDEIIVKINRDDVFEFIDNEYNNGIVGRIERINMLEDSNNSKKYIERINRLFNKKYFKYDGIIHEQIVSINQKSYNTELVDIRAEHIGYTKEVLNKTNKLKRNIELLNKAVENKEDDPYLYFQLGKSYFMLKDFNRCCNYFEKALNFELDYNLEYVEDLVETYGYALVNSGKCIDALYLEQYETYYKNSPDFYFMIGIIYMNNAEFSKAVESFLQCTKFSYGKVEGVTSFLAYYNIGVIYDVLGFREQAIDYYKLCGFYEPAVKRLREQMN